MPVELPSSDPYRPGPHATARRRSEAANELMGRWLRNRRRELEALVGWTITGWDGVEMAIWETSPDGPVFTDPAIPFLQLSWLRLTAHSGELTVGTYQDDGYCGLCAVDRGAPGPADCWGIFRWRELTLPTGRVDAVDVVLEEGELSRVTVTVAGQAVLLVAGEVYETRGDRLEVHRLDESVLVFLDPADADRVDWR